MVSRTSAHCAPRHLGFASTNWSSAAAESSLSPYITWQSCLVRTRERSFSSRCAASSSSRSSAFVMARLLARPAHRARTQDLDRPPQAGDPLVVDRMGCLGVARSECGHLRHPEPQLLPDARIDRCPLLHVAL